MSDDIELKIESIKKWLGSGSINLFGLPYSGKDTHGKEIASMLEGPLIGGGDIIRASENEELKNHIATGKLAPQQQYLDMILPYLSQGKYTGKPLVLSSVGRWIGEEESIIASAKSSGHEIKVVIFLHTSTDEAKRRWKESNRARHDDIGYEVFEKRLQEFEEKTMPVVAVYDNKDLLITVDATPPIPVVTMNIIDELYARSKQQSK